jgi:hypothetical protein
MFSASSVQSVYKEEFIWEVVVESSRVESSSETPACQVMNFREEEWNWVESLELAIAE